MKNPKIEAPLIRMDDGVLHRLPGIVSPTLKNEALTLEISDLYETLPMSFQEKVPKTHRRLRELISFQQNMYSGQNKINL